MNGLSAIPSLAVILPNPPYKNKKNQMYLYCERILSKVSKKKEDYFSMKKALQLSVVKHSVDPKKLNLCPCFVKKTLLLKKNMSLISKN